MNILVIGGHGQVGTELVQQPEAFNFKVVAPPSSELDITKPDSIQHCIDRKDIGMVINAAAYTAVDKAESEPDRAFAINRDGAGNVASACAEFEIPLIHLSTDYVFDGSKKTPYTEDDPLSPLGMYGESKAQGEQAVQQSYQQHIILRTSWVYGLQGHNFVKTMLRLGTERNELRIVADQYGCPTSARDLGTVILNIAGQILAGNDTHWGIYHYCGAGQTNWFEFARAIFDQAALLAKNVESAKRYSSLQLSPITTDEYPTPAQRPPYSVLDCARIQEIFDIQQARWQESLEEMLNRYLAIFEQDN